MEREWGGPSSLPGGELTELTFHWRRLEGVWCHWGKNDRMKCMETEQAYKEKLDDMGQITHAMGQTLKNWTYKMCLFC